MDQTLREPRGRLDPRLTAEEEAEVLRRLERDMERFFGTCSCCTPDPANEERNERLQGPA